LGISLGLIKSAPISVPKAPATYAITLGKLGASRNALRASAWLGRKLVSDRIRLLCVTKQT
ncbi:MAG TPA: hypothetical protein VEC43_02105, partial [Candidatus Acidoferrales bacterium]|nr:hypothetical protein [Candidatus Acidoferrales bacterium]